MNFPPYSIVFYLLLLHLALATTAGVSAQSVLTTRQDDSKDLSSAKDNLTDFVGRSIERGLQPREVHFYTVTAKSGQYFRVVVIQKGIDIIVKLIGPDDRVIVEVDSPNERYGPEPVSAIAPMAGTYRLEVRALRADEADGRYEITLQALREPTISDRNRIAAERLLVEAEHLHAKVTKESLRAAVDKYNEALPLLRAIGDRWKEGETLTVMGRVHFLLGDPGKAIEYHSQALALNRLNGDRYGENAALNGLGSSYGSLGETRKAIGYLEQALAITLEIKNHAGEAYTRKHIGALYVPINRRKAVEYLNESLALARALKNQRLEAQVLLVLGGASFQYGEPQLALNYYNQALQLQQLDQWYQARAIQSVGAVYRMLDELPQSLRYFEEALSLHRASGNRLEEVYVLHYIGDINSTLGDSAKAIGYFENALATAREIGNSQVEAAVLISLANVYAKLGDLNAALRHVSRSASIFQALNNKSEAYARATLGRLYLKLGKNDEAINSSMQALRLFRAAEDQAGEAGVLSEIGFNYYSVGKTEDAVGLLKQALSLHRASSQKWDEAVALQRLASVERSRGRLDNAREYIEAAINILDEIRQSIFDPDLRTSFSAARRDYYELYIDILMQLHRRAPTAGHDATALQINERRRARTLLEILVESKADIRQGIQPALLERERSTQQQLTAKVERLLRLRKEQHTPEEELELRKDFNDLLRSYRDIEAEIRATSPRYAALTQPQTLSLREIQQDVLDDNTVLVEYALGRERSYAYVVSKRTLATYELPSRTEIERVARDVYDLFIKKTDSLYPEVLAQLSKMILQPMADHLTRKRLLIVSDGALQYIPFAALPVPTAKSQLNSKNSKEYKPLILFHDVISLPSASVLATHRRQFSQRPVATKKLVVIADPVFDSNDERVTKNRSATAPGNTPTNAKSYAPFLELQRTVNDVGLIALDRLTNSRSEAEFITAHLKEREYLKALDFAANSRLATSAELSNYQIVHFATHSLLNNENPELSGIVLSLVDERGQPQNGFVPLAEIYNLKLDADLVVLSSCQTALGKDMNGEGLIGLTRGFMYAGAPRVVASLWKVSDAATGELMKLFYENMLTKRMPPGAALRSAQVSLSRQKQWAAPYYWAGFVIQGDWQ